MLKRLLFIVMGLSIFFHSADAQFRFSSFGVNTGTNLLIGDFRIIDSKLTFNQGIYGIAQLSPKLNLKMQVGYGELGVYNVNETVVTSFIPVEASCMYLISPESRFETFLHSGLGLMSFSTNGSERYYDGMVFGGFGLNMSLNSSLSLLFTADLRYTTGDDFNKINKGLNDGYMAIQTGVTYHFNNHEKKYAKQNGDIRTKLFAQKIIESAPDTNLVANEVQKIQNSSVATGDLNQYYENLKTELALKESEIEELQMINAIKNNKLESLKTNSSESGSITIFRRLTPEISKRFEIILASNKAYHLRQINSYEVESVYQHALRLIRQRNFNQAIGQLVNLYKSFPDHPLAANMLYWIGESYFGQQNYVAAAEVFENIQVFHESAKKDDALIMAGLCYRRLGNVLKANQKFRDLLNMYPQSEFAGKAKRYLRST